MECVTSQSVTNLPLPLLFFPLPLLLLSQEPIFAFLFLLVPINALCKMNTAHFPDLKVEHVARLLKIVREMRVRHRDPLVSEGVARAS